MEQLLRSLFVTITLLLLALHANGGAVSDADQFSTSKTIAEDLYPEIFQDERSALSDVTNSNYSVAPPKPKSELIGFAALELNTPTFTSFKSPPLLEKLVYSSQSVSPYSAQAPPLHTF